MKYFTKEWYKLCQNTSYHFLLKSIEKKCFSEDYYLKLYNKKLNEYVLLRKQINELKSNEIIDYEQERINFKNSLLNYTNHLKSNLPIDILEKVFDIRILALGEGTEEVIDLITKFCNDNKRKVEEVLENYHNYQETILDIDFVRRLGFHDRFITEVSESENEFVIYFDSTESVTFEGYKLKVLDQDLIDSIWLYEEIYKVDGGFEIHVLLYKNDDLIDFIFNTENVKVNSIKIT